MRILLLAVATITVAAPVPVEAQTDQSMQFSARSGSGHHGGFDRRDRRRHRGGDTVYYDGYREYQGDTTWKSESFNDWWHDRPDRAYPRWVTANQNCERKWFAADTLRC